MDRDGFHPRPQHHRRRDDDPDRPRHDRDRGMPAGRLSVQEAGLDPGTGASAEATAVGTRADLLALRTIPLPANAGEEPRLSDPSPVAGMTCTGAVRSIL